MATPKVGALGVVEAKGDLPGFDGDDLRRLAVGNDGEALVADTTAPTGLSYKPVTTSTDSTWRRHFLLMGG